jgi:hypothetical protein
MRYSCSPQKVLANQTRILGWRRLGWNVLLGFREDLPEGETPLHWDQSIDH